MIRPSRLAFLVVLWVLLWGRLSIANVASGLVVALVVTVAFPTGGGERYRFPVRPFAQLRLIGVVGWQLLAANVALVREVVARRSRMRPGVVVCRLRSDEEWVAALVANILALAPGTMPVRVGTDPAVVHIHVLHLDEPTDVRRMVARLERLVVAAYGRNPHPPSDVREAR